MASASVNAGDILQIIDSGTFDRCACPSGKSGMLITNLAGTTPTIYTGTGINNNSITDSAGSLRIIGANAASRIRVGISRSNRPGIYFMGGGVCEAAYLTFFGNAGFGAGQGVYAELPACTVNVHHCTTETYVSALTSTICYNGDIVLNVYDNVTNCPLVNARAWTGYARRNVVTAYTLWDASGDWAGGGSSGYVRVLADNTMIVNADVPWAGGYGISQSIGIMVNGLCSAYNNTVVSPGGQAYTNVNGIWITANVAGTDVRNNIVKGCNYGVNGAAKAIYNNLCNGNRTANYNGVTAGVTNLVSDPLMVDYAGGNFDLGTGSPCIGAGANTAEVSDVHGLAWTLPYDIGSAKFVSLAPQVTACTATGEVTVEVGFDSDMAVTGAFLTPSNYPLTPTDAPPGVAVTVSAVVAVGLRTARLTISEGTNSKHYQVAVVNVLSALGNVVDPAHNFATMTAIGVSPTVTSAANTARTTIRVQFSEAMHQTAGNIAVAGSWAITGGPTISAAVPSGSYVDLTVSALACQASYTVTAPSGCADVAGNAIGTRAATFTAQVKPRVTSAIGTRAVILVAFDEDMSQSAGSIADKDAWAVTTLLGAVVPLFSVTLDGGTGAMLITSVDMVWDEIYNVVCPELAEDTHGNAVEPAYRAGAWTAKPAPMVVSIAQSTDYLHADVVFDHPVDTTGAFLDPDSYPLTPTDEGADVDVTDVAVVNSITARLTHTEGTIGKHYQVDVAEAVVDLLGHGVDPDRNHAVLTAGGLAATVVSASYVDATHVQAVCSEPMHGGTLADWLVLPQDGMSNSVAATAVTMDGVNANLTVQPSMMFGGAYQVVAPTDLVDAGGNPVDPDVRSADFLVPGRRVQVRGFYFLDGASVELGPASVDAPVYFRAANALVVGVPAEATVPGDVVVANADGKSGAAKDAWSPS